MKLKKVITLKGPIQCELCDFSNTTTCVGCLGRTKHYRGTYKKESDNRYVSVIYLYM